MIGGKPLIATIAFYSIVVLHGKTVFGVCGLCTYTADMVSDLKVAWDLFARGEVLYGCLVLLFTYIPMFFSLLMSKKFRRYRDKRNLMLNRLNERIMLLPILLVFRRIVLIIGGCIVGLFNCVTSCGVVAPIAPFIIMVTGIASTCRGQEPSPSVGFVKIVEPFTESFLQTLLQTMIVFKSLPDYETSQIASIVISLFTMGFGVSTNAVFKDAATSSKVAYFFAVPLGVATKAVVFSMLALVNTYLAIFAIIAEWWVYYGINYMNRSHGGRNLGVYHVEMEQHSSGAGVASYASNTNPAPYGEGEDQGSNNMQDSPDESQNNSNGQSTSCNYSTPHDLQVQDSSLVSASDGSNNIRVPLNILTQRNPTIVSVSDGSTFIRISHDVETYTTLDEDTAHEGSNTSLILSSDTETQNTPNEKLLLRTKACWGSLSPFPFDSFTPFGFAVSSINLVLSLVGLFIDVPSSVVIAAITLASANVVTNGIIGKVPQLRYIMDDWLQAVDNFEEMLDGWLGHIHRPNNPGERLGNWIRGLRGRECISTNHAPLNDPAA